MLPYPSDADFHQLKAEAAKRRAALKQAGCSTYTLGFKRGQSAILCLCCGMSSPNPNDIAEKYCGFCHDWHSEWIEVSQSLQKMAF